MSNGSAELDRQDSLSRTRKFSVAYKILPPIIGALETSTQHPEHTEKRRRR